VVAYARNIDNLGALASRVERITQKHVALNILPQHYPFVAEALLGAIKDVLGEARYGRDPRGLGRGVLVPGRPADGARGQHLQPPCGRAGRLERLARLRGREREAEERGHPLLCPGPS
jgi:hypothetical protein